MSPTDKYTTFVRELAKILKRGDITKDFPDGYEPDATDPAEDPAATLETLLERARSIVESDK